MKSYTAILEEDPETGDLIIPFSEEFCKEHDWQPGDELDMVAMDDGTIHITNMSWLMRNQNGFG